MTRVLALLRECSYILVAVSAEGFTIIQPVIHLAVHDGLVVGVPIDERSVAAKSGMIRAQAGAFALTLGALVGCGLGRIRKALPGDSGIALRQFGGLRWHRWSSSDHEAFSKGKSVSPDRHNLDLTLAARHVDAHVIAVALVVFGRYALKKRGDLRDPHPLWNLSGNLHDVQRTLTEC